MQEGSFSLLSLGGGDKEHAIGTLFCVCIAELVQESSNQTTIPLTAGAGPTDVQVQGVCLADRSTRSSRARAGLPLLLRDVVPVTLSHTDETLTVQVLIAGL